MSERDNKGTAGRVANSRAWGGGVYARDAAIPISGNNVIARPPPWHFYEIMHQRDVPDSVKFDRIRLRLSPLSESLSQTRSLLPLTLPPLERGMRFTAELELRTCWSVRPHRVSETANAE